MKVPSSILAVSLAAFLVLSLMALPAALVVRGESDSLTIAEGSYEMVDIEANGKAVWYKVTVMSGGAVDVFMADMVEFWSGTIHYYPGHSHMGVRSVEDTLRDSSGTVYLVVDNGDGIGTASTGVVTVDIEWELRTDWVGISIGIIILTLIIVGIAARFVWARRKARAVETQTEIVYDDGTTDQRLYDTLQDDQRYEGAPSGEFCMGCGREKVYDPRLGRAACPNCEGAGY